MSRPLRTGLILAGLLAAAAVVFGCGLGWGLPSKETDSYLFGERTPWTGKEILELAGNWSDDPNRGADVDIDPLAYHDTPILLNENDAQRAAIVRRYRLYSFQPDEMITLRALASMRPSEGRLDPKLYQYGGLWVYPVGVMIQLASAAGYLKLKSDVVWYLDHPAEFGKFYVVARLYTLLWGLVGAVAVFSLTRKLTGGCDVAGAVAGLCAIIMPVVVNMGHEAKPHLPAAVLMLLAVLAAMRYVESGQRRWWAVTAVLCGAAFGMVLSAWPIFVVLPVMLLLRRAVWEDVITRTVFGGLIGAGVYVLTNPYVVINLFVNRAVLESNFGNSLAMYEVSQLGEGVINAAWLVLEGTSPILAVFGAGGALWLSVRSLRKRTRVGAVNRPALGWLLAAPALVIGIQFVALAAGKPGEYGRFAVLPDVALAIAAVTAVRSRITQLVHGVVPMLLLFVMTGAAGSDYLVGFSRDASGHTSRGQVACQLQAYEQSGARSLGVVTEPAPYCMPPVDLFRWKIYLLPTDSTAEMIGRLDVLVRAWGTHCFADGTEMKSHRPDPPMVLELDTKPISWADKRFDVQVRRGKIQR